MRVRSVELKDFRQFAGSVTVPISHSKEKPFTIVYGTTGGGKTTLLSAIYWAFHGSTPYISSSELLANFDAFKNLGDDGELEISVAVQVSDRGYDFEIRRTRKVKKVNGREVIIDADRVTFLGADGAFITPAQLEINRRFPSSLAKFFFVPGESIDSFFSQSSLPQLVENIKAISEIGSYESAIQVAEEVEAKLRKAISDSATSPALKNANAAIASFTEENDKLLEIKSNLISEIHNIEVEVLELGAAVKSPELMEEMGALAASLDSEIEIAKSKLMAVDLEISTFLSTYGYLAFSEDLLTDVSKALDGIGVITGEPRSFDRNTLKAISGDSLCVCGRHIGESEKNYILALSEQASESSHEEFIGSMLGYLEGAFSFDEFRNEYSDSLSRRSALEPAIRALELERDSQLSALPDGQTDQEIYSRWLETKANLAEAQRRLESTNILLAENDDKLEKANKRLLAAIEKGSNQDLMERQRVAVSRIRVSLQSTLDNHKTLFMNELEVELNQIISKFVFSPVVAKLKENFEFDLIDEDRGTIFGESGGQTKAKAIAMVVALYRIASRKARESMKLDDDAPTEFPLLIDSAFGELGGELRRRVGEELSNSQGQLVLLVSDSQAIGLTEGLDTSLVGVELLLHSFATGPGSDVRTPPINGQAVTWLTFNSQSIRTELEVLNG